MKNNKASSGLLNQILSFLASITKPKSFPLKSKTYALLRTRLLISSLLPNKNKLLKLQTLLALGDKKPNKDDDDDDDDDDDVDTNDQSKAIIPTNNNGGFYHYQLKTKKGYGETDEVEDEVEKYPDLTHALFGSEDVEFDQDAGGSVIDMVKNNKGEGEEFNLEEEIDEVADLFIKRFHRQIRMQKQLSLKRYQEMLIRSA